MNLPGLEVPQFVIPRVTIRVDQHDGVKITTTSELSNFVAVIFDPADAILMNVNDDSCVDELIVFPGVQGNVPYD